MMIRVVVGSVVSLVVGLYFGFLIGSHTPSSYRAIEVTGENYCTLFRPHFALNENGTWACLDYEEWVAR